MKGSFFIFGLISVELIGALRGVSQLYCSRSGCSSRRGALARWARHFVRSAATAFSLGNYSGRRIPVRAHSDFQLYSDRGEWTGRLWSPGNFSSESAAGFFSRTVRHLAADRVSRALRLLHLVPRRGERE